MAPDSALLSKLLTSCVLVCVCVFFFFFTVMNIRSEHERGGHVMTQL